MNSCHEEAGMLDSGRKHPPHYM
eukprot:gene955-biopygen9382